MSNINLHTCEKSGLGAFRMPCEECGRVAQVRTMLEDIFGPSAPIPRNAPFAIPPSTPEEPT